MTTLILSREDAMRIYSLLQRGVGEVEIRPCAGVGYELGSVKILARELIEARPA